MVYTIDNDMVYTVDMVHTVDTVDTVYTLDTAYNVYTIETALACMPIQRYEKFLQIPKGGGCGQLC